MADRLLLDTHVFIWWRENSRWLGQPASERIANAAVAFVSVAIAWEAAIKVALGKLRLPESFERGIDDSRFDRLAIAFDHAEKSGRCRITIAIRSVAC